MKERTRDWPQPNDKAPLKDRNPDRSKCRDQESKELAGHTPGDRGMCEKASEVQGSE